MHCLSQVFELSSYLLKNPKLISDKEGITFDFNEYMKNLWKDNGINFAPKDFLIKLRKISEKKFLYDKELDPYIFCNFILIQLNKELNCKDQEIKSYFSDFLKKYTKNEKLKNYYQKIIKENNSIITKTLGGIFKDYINCESCHKNEEIRYECCNIIDIDLNDFYKKKKASGLDINSINLTDCINSYFNEKKKILSTCKCGKKDKKYYLRKIIEIPDYLIFRINYGQFIDKEGFKFKINDNYPITQDTLIISENIEIKSDYFDNESNADDKGSCKFQIFSTLDYFLDKNIFITKYRLKEEKKNKWFAIWCNSNGKEKGTYIDKFSTPCLIFYEKIN